MSGKMKKLICALIAGTMLVSSIGLVGFAADEEVAAETPAVEETAETTEPEAEVEAEAEATEAPAAPTQAPVTASSSAYDSDSYYQKALSLCQALGIITGYEDGSVKPDSTVTRAEMAAIILRMINYTSTSTYQNIFTDVTSSHWAADTIQTASALSIINGMGDGTFAPDGNVTYEQVAKMIVCAMNFTDSAEYYGGYPNGYIKVASDKEITKNAPGTIGVASERGVVIKMVYNALLADYNEPNGTEYGQQVFKAERSLAEYAFNVKEDKGILMGTSTTSLTSKKLLNGQALIDETIYNTDLPGLDSLLASYVTFYYSEEDNGDTRNLLAVVENTTKTETVTLDNDQVQDIEQFTGFDNAASTGSIKLYGSKTYKIAKEPLVVYNGAVITEKDFEDAQANAAKNDVRFYKNITKDEAGTTTSDPKDYNEFLLPSVGTIKLVENNSDEDGYDIVFVDSYETMLVSTATTKKLTGNVNGVSTTIDVDEDASDLTITTTISGMEAAPRNLKKNQVVSIKRSLDGETLEFVATGESVTGSATNKSEDGDKTYVSVGGTTYEVDANAVSSIKVGSQAIFYLDQFNRIGYIETATADGMLAAGEAYGWVMNIYDSEDGEDTIVRIATEDGSKDYTVGSTLNYWAPKGTAAETLSGKSTISSTLKSLISSSLNFETLGDSTSESSATPIRLVKYKTNSSNQLTKLYFATSKTTNTDALVINTTNLNGHASVSGAVDGYTISDGIMEITAPKEKADMTTASNYSFGEVTSTNYVVRENGSSRDYIIGEFDGIVANIVIQFTSSATAKAEYTEMGTAENGPSIMVVDTIAEGYDEDNDVSIYQITGYSGGSKVSVTTNKNTNLGAAQNSLFTRANNQTYFAFNELWNAPNPNGNKLTDYLQRGDILLYNSDGRVLLKFASAADATFDEDGNFVESSIPTVNVSGYYGTARVAYYFEKVVDHGLDDTAWVNLENSGTFIFDSSMNIDVVTITSTGKITIEKETATISEIEDGDYLLINLADKLQTTKSLIIYRFE